MARFDPPRTVGIATDAAGKQIACTVYGDLVVRESDTDMPDPEDAALIRLPAGEASDCAAAPGPAARKLATGGQRFLGLRAGFLVFEQASTNGMIPFAVLDAASGRTLSEDTTTYEGIDSFSVEDDGLRIAFRRRVQADCSIPKQDAACWKRIVREANILELIAALPTPVKACAAYRIGKTPRDADSIVYFPVRLAWTGSRAVAASGPVQCRPTP
ncbi:hypothetical protein [Methylobacterium fujisawaense]|uniref:hypothetical protein n=1 Tax=Methylobacterium fujisawaense TaxID=107400 RepID=UPI002F35EDA3